MAIKFLLMVNKQGQTRLAKYFDEFLSVDERRVLEGEIVRKCLARTDKQVTDTGPLLYPYSRLPPSVPSSSIADTRSSTEDTPLFFS